MNSINDSTLALLALWLIPGLGPRRILSLLEKFSCTEAIFNATPNQLAEALSTNVQTTYPIQNSLDSKELKNEVSLIKKHKVNILDITQDSYPSLLKEIYNPPPVLYFKGENILSNDLPLAFVGSRKSSYAGKNACKNLIKRISELQPNTCIISGLAIGVDTTAHQSALENGLKTIAVLANGLSSIYPERNKQLAESIIEQGAIVTEFPMSTKPTATNFPLRNRIISGLSKGTVVVEAGERSGATITAGYALEQNRELFALPGPIGSSFHRGTNRLIQKGQAKLVMEAEDILEEFVAIDYQLSVDDLKKSNNEQTKDLTEIEQKILDQIEKDFNQKDQIISQLQLPIQDIMSALTMLEIKGVIIKKPGSTYEKA